MKDDDEQGDMQLTKKIVVPMNSFEKTPEQLEWRMKWIHS